MTTYASIRQLMLQRQKRKENKSLRPLQTADKLANAAITVFVTGGMKTADATLLISRTLRDYNPRSVSELINTAWWTDRTLE